MAKHYVICENMCLQEAYSKDEIDKLNERLYFKISLIDCVGYGGGTSFVNKGSSTDYLKIINQYYIESIMIEDKNSKYEKQTPIGAVLKDVNGDSHKIIAVDVKYVSLGNGEYGAIFNYTFDSYINEPISFDAHIFLRKIHEEPKLING